jgi:hypothetical protein
VRPFAIASLDALPCPLCGDVLERGAGREGLVWICRGCRGGALTLPILRRFAPRPFVNHLWQSALHAGRPSALRCPACRHNFTEVADILSPRILACVRCYWVWIDREGCGFLTSSTAVRVPLPPPSRCRRRRPGVCR